MNNNGMNDNIEKYLKNLPYIENKDLYKAIYKTICLIVERDFPLLRAIQCSTNLYSTKSHIEKYVRSCFPDDFFTRRRSRKLFEHLGVQKALVLMTQYKKAEKIHNDLDRDFRKKIAKQ